MRFFPWYCGECQEETVYMATVQYEITWVTPHVVMSKLQTPQCRLCGALHFTEDTDEQIRIFLGLKGDTNAMGIQNPTNDLW